MVKKMETLSSSIDLQAQSQIRQIEREQKEIERQKKILTIQKTARIIMNNPIFDSNKDRCQIPGSYGYNPKLLSENRKDEAGVLLDELSCLAETSYKLDVKDLFNEMYRFFASNKAFANINNTAGARMSRLWDSYIRLQFIVAETTAAQL